MPQQQTNNTSVKTNYKRISGLDVIRFVAIIIVVIYHSVPLLHPLNNTQVAGGIVHFALGLTEPFGILGVELFFALSGFLIGTILIKTYLNSPHFGFGDVRSFLVRRWFRTVPAYWLILLANLILYTILGRYSFRIDYLQYFIFAQNLIGPHPRFFREAWSLAVEEWFYLVTPLVLLGATYALKMLSKRRILTILLILYPITFLVLRAVTTDNNNPNPLYFDHSVRKIVVLRLSSISYGLLIAYLMYFYEVRLNRLRKPLLAIGLTGLMILTAIHYAGVHPRFQLYRLSYSYRVFHNIFLVTMLPLFSSFLLPYAYAVRSLESRAISNLITFVSKISYSMYLLHFTFILNAAMPFLHLTTTNCVPIYIAYWAVLIGMSTLIYHYVELPMMNLRNKFSKADPGV